MLLVAIAGFFLTGIANRKQWNPVVFLTLSVGGCVASRRQRGGGSLAGVGPESDRWQHRGSAKFAKDS